jgi:hypothetical protein
MRRAHRNEREQQKEGIGVHRHRVDGRWEKRENEHRAACDNGIDPGSCVAQQSPEGTEEGEI